MDDGCKEGGPSCLSCRLPVCKYDAPGIVRRFEKEMCYREYVKATERGMAAQEIALVSKVSKRTIYRALEWARKEGVNE